MNLSIIRSSPSLSHAQFSPPELSVQITLLSPPESPSCLLRIATAAQEMTVRVSGPWIRNNLLLRRAAGVTTPTATDCHSPRWTRGLVTNRACDSQWLFPAPASAVDLLCGLLPASSIVLCTGLLLCSVEGKIWTFCDPRRELAR